MVIYLIDLITKSCSNP